MNSALNSVFQGSRNTISRAIVTNYTFDELTETVNCNATAGAFSVFLPQISLFPGRSVTIRKTDATANNVTITRSGTDLIQGATSVALGAQWSVVTLTNDGTQWMQTSASTGTGAVPDPLTVGTANIGNLSVTTALKTSLVPDVTGTLNLGSPTLKYNNTYSGNTYASALQALGDVSVIAANTGAKLGYLTSGTNGLWLHESTPTANNAVIITSSTNTVVQAPGNVQLRPNGVTAFQVSSTNISTLLPFTVNDVVRPNGTNMYALGTSSLVWTNVHSTTFTAYAAAAGFALTIPDQTRIGSSALYFTPTTANNTMTLTGRLVANAFGTQDGIQGYGSGANTSGVLGAGGTNGVGVWGVGGSGNGIGGNFIATGSGVGINVTATSGGAITATSTGSNAITGTCSTGNGAGLVGYGAGSGAGVYARSPGIGGDFASTGTLGIQTVSSANDGIQATTTAANASGVYGAATNNGQGGYFISGATTGSPAIVAVQRSDQNVAIRMGNRATVPAVSAGAFTGGDLIVVGSKLYIYTGVGGTNGWVVVGTQT